MHLIQSTFLARHPSKLKVHSNIRNKNRGFGGVGTISDLREVPATWGSGWRYKLLDGTPNAFLSNNYRCGIAQFIYTYHVVPAAGALAIALFPFEP